MEPTVRTDRGQLAKAMAKIEAEVRDGLKHGHFDLAISSSIGNEGIRDLVVRAGKAFRFRIAKDEAESLN